MLKIVVPHRTSHPELTFNFKNSFAKKFDECIDKYYYFQKSNFYTHRYK